MTGPHAEERSSGVSATGDLSVRRRTALTSILITVGLILVLVAAAQLGYWRYGETVWINLILKQFFVVVGLPMAAAAAFIVVLFFESRSEGVVVFKLLGMELSGPAGPTVLWVICYVSIVWSIYLLKE